MRILALDWGTVRIGGALSDPEGKIAFPLDKFIDPKHSLDEIQKIVNENQVEKVLIGLPRALSGNETLSTKKAQEFAEKLQILNLPIDFIDERLSSKSASNTLSGAGLSKKNQRDRVDNLAAAQMLQSYLDNHS